MRTREGVRTAPTHAITPRAAAAALVLLAVILAGTTGVLRVSVSGEPPALAVSTTTR